MRGKKRLTRAAIRGNVRGETDHAGALWRMGGRPSPATMEGANRSITREGLSVGVIEDTIKAIERIPSWKRALAAPAEIDALRARIEELEKRLAPATGDQCPKCRAMAFQLIETVPADAPWGAMGPCGVLDLHAASARETVSSGYRSGRRSLRGTPVSRSTGSTHPAGMRFRAFQLDTTDCLTPSRRESAVGPPTAPNARSMASSIGAIKHLLC